MLPEIRVQFCITSTNLTSDRITNLIGISPTHTWNIGDAIRGTNSRREHNGWCVVIKSEETLDVTESLKTLLHIISPKSKLINDSCAKYNLESEVSCVIYITDETPIINFDRDIIFQLSKLNTTLDIDIILLE